MLCVEGRPSYVRCENFNDRPLYRLAGAQGTLKFDGTGWVVHRSNGTEAARSESAEAVPTLGSWSGGSLQVSVCQLPFPTAPRFIWVEGAGTERVNGCYACTDSYHEKPRYLRVGGEGNIYVDGVWKIGQSNATSGWTYKSHDQAADHAVPPTTRWTKDGPGVDPPPKLYPMQRYSETAPEASSTADSTPSSSEPPFLVVRGAGDDDINGRYACVGSYGGAPKYRKLGGTSIMFYESGLWRLNDEENTNQRLYDGPASRTPLPTSGWILIHDGFREPAPTVSFGNHGDLQVGDEVIIVKNSDRVDWSNCPQSDRLIFLHPPWPLTVDRIEGDWWFSTDFPHKIAPLSALGSAKFNDRQHSISAAGTLRSSATASDTRSDHDAPTRPASGTPFLVVRGAGDARVNGRYACVGTHSDAPKFRKVGGTAIMFYQSGMWRLFHEDDTNKRFYDGPAARTPLPTSGWRALNERVNGVQCAPAPTVSFGSHRDLQTGDRVKVTKRNSETDWSGCPQDDRFQYVGAPDIRTIDRIEGDWWFNTDFPSAISPLAVLGEVRLNDGWHIISAVERTVASATASSSQAPPQQQEQVAEDGFDEEWCPDQDLERFQCCICMLVARNAMVHECGAALFCEMCWVKCQQDSSNCPMCREDGSSIVPAHSDRRLIRNLMIMCPNKCGEKVSLCEKDPSWHVHQCLVLCCFVVPRLPGEGYYNGII